MSDVKNELKTNLEASNLYRKVPTKLGGNRDLKPVTVAKSQTVT